MTEQQTQRILAITGHTGNLDEALDEFENVKQAVAELYDENQAYEILNRRLRLCLDLAETGIAAAQTDAGMFITEKTRAKINQFFEQVAKCNQSIVLSKVIQQEH